MLGPSFLRSKHSVCCGVESTQQTVLTRYIDTAQQALCACWGVKPTQQALLAGSIDTTQQELCACWGVEPTQQALLAGSIDTTQQALCACWNFELTQQALLAGSIDTTSKRCVLAGVSRRCSKQSAWWVPILHPVSSLLAGLSVRRSKHPLAEGADPTRSKYFVCWGVGPTPPTPGKHSACWGAGPTPPTPGKPCLLGRLSGARQTLCLLG